ncbi:uncharacterized protein LOC118199300 [Stegodyphus dumicola]|uniref:uncharacterized protein LOC118199300 n=1 Tax=Stegodyphus dumicola TaxID=202533 RepID=UPI0015A9A390|nr:uncharacterized protein LOC118199300 [Stegodyphus dumicola]
MAFYFCFLDEVLIPEEKREVDDISEFRDYIRQVGNQFGDGTIKLPSIENLKEPIALQDFNISLNFHLGNIFGLFTSLQLYSLKGSQLNNVTINLSKMEICATMSMPFLGIKGQYFLDSNMLLMSQYGGGAFLMNMTTKPLQGHSRLQITSDGKLNVGHFNISFGIIYNECVDGYFSVSEFNFENLKSKVSDREIPKGSWGGSRKWQMIREIGSKVQASLLSALGSYVQQKLKTLLLKLPPRYIDPINTNVMEYILNNLAESMTGNDMEPLHLPESTPDQLREISGKFFNVTVDGSSTFSRKGDIIVNVYNNFIAFGACFEFQNLTGSSMWEVDILGENKRGQVRMEMTSVSAFIRLQQNMVPGSKLELDYLLFEDVCHNWLDSKSLKKLGSTQEDSRSKLSSTLANYIITEWHRVVNKRMLAELEELSIQLPNESTSLIKYFYLVFYGKKPKKAC